MDGFEANAGSWPQFSAELLRDIGDYWNALKSLEVNPQIHALWLNITHQRVMISTTWVLQHLFEDCRTLLTALSANHRPHIFKTTEDQSCDCIQNLEIAHGDTSTWSARLTLDLAQKTMTHGVTTKWQWDVSFVQYLDPPVRISHQLVALRRRNPANDAQWDWDAG